MNILLSQKQNLEKEKVDYLKSLVQKISKKFEEKPIEEITEAYLESQGYLMFGNYNIGDIVNDYLYLIEDFLLSIEERVRRIPFWVVILYLKVSEWTLDRSLTDEELTPFAVLVRIQTSGDCLLDEYDQSKSMGRCSFLSFL